MQASVCLELRDLDRPRWGLQTKSHQTSGPPSSSLTGDFKRWTNVPPVGVKDPECATLERGERRHFEPKYCPPGLMDKGGKRCLPGPSERPRTEGKRTFAHLTRRSGFDADMQGRAQGVRYVQCAAKGTRGAAGANPNEGASAAVLRPEGVRITRDAAGAVKHGQVRYKAWQPPTLAKAEGGDWNLNTRYGNRKVGKDATGRPMREAETPIAWPSYAAYPPDRDARGNLVDYALAKHGGIFKDAKKEHPDLKFARESRSAGYAVNQHNKLRHAGLWHY